MNNNVLLDAFVNEADCLHTAMRQSGLDLDYQAALDVTARLKGESSWGALHESLTAAGDDVQWLLWLQAALELSGCTRDDLDARVDAELGSDTDDAVNAYDEGVFSQLCVLFNSLANDPDVEFPRGTLVAMLEEDGDVSLPMPESMSGDARRAVSMRIRSCPGTPFEETMKVDALEWLANHGADDIASLMLAGLRDSEAAEGVVSWLASHSEDVSVREELTAFFNRMDAAHAGEPASKVPFSVRIKAAGVQRFILMRMKNEEAEDAREQD